MPHSSRQRLSRPIRVDVVGSPYKIGDRIVVRTLCDEFGDESFLGKCGNVEYLEYDCGCGQTYPDDPMIGVRFLGGEVEEFWAEELKLLTR